jgi:hypothetical protein
MIYETVIKGLVRGVSNLKTEVIASAANLTLDPNCILHSVTGTTNINLISSVGYSNGAIAILIFPNQSYPSADIDINPDVSSSGNYKTIHLSLNGAGSTSAISPFGVTLVYHTDAWWQVG